MEADYHLINKTDLPAINLRKILNLISENNIFCSQYYIEFQ